MSSNTVLIATHKKVVVALGRGCITRVQECCRQPQTSQAGFDMTFCNTSPAGSIPM